MMVRLRVYPRAKRSRFDGQIAGLRGEQEWKLYLTAPALEGKANEACIGYLAEELGIPRSRVRIVSGEKSRHKLVELEGVSEEEFLRFANG
jgi:uncharacterized protein (TIGR00251 family)